ncbi:monofunctional biosynthetic peptidoglycan transglycosylase [Candidatus Chrysopegis kryptomonas]|uniref:Biosynthetic peptidoglycan transglycosylase n=1 Tax=Candidatus Chryseopegocella kryptomonas TaxID=1633643 RepID=A0A0N7MX48_9BACT|nr:monofunctional biosynthetic peptidoglycan transglycosylase [Candidatus Chrysopegis kryptomonas]CUT00443.1 monofunctional biosynthetic peptidoglycan transglycosylase [Candidatus Chrysopegis kryptomonas]
MRKIKIAIALVILFFAGYLIYEFVKIDREIEKLKYENPKITALMKQRMNEAKRKGKPYRINQIWIPLSRVSPYLIDAVIVSEDASFFSHQGIDWYEVKESIKKNFERGKIVRGASTITMQVAKNLFLSTSRNPLRKFVEVLIALRMEQKLSKRRILEIYLNIVELGDGIFGVESASRRYFGKSASELTLEESARLVSIIPSPLRYTPNSNKKFVNWRTKLILNRLLAREKIKAGFSNESGSIE